MNQLLSCRNVIVIVLFTILSIAFLHSEAKSANSPSHTTSSAHSKITLQLNGKYQFEHAGYIAAKEKGYYQDVGLNVELKELKRDTHTIVDVISGRANFWNRMDDLKRISVRFSLKFLINLFCHDRLLKKYFIESNQIIQVIKKISMVSASSDE